MPCDHLGGPELIEMSEKSLRENGVPVANWAGSRFQWAENLDAGMWASVIVEVERRGDQWVVTRLDRRKQALPDTEVGFRRLA